MEQQKILLIIVSVSFFLALVLGVGLWLFYPRGTVAESAQGPEGTTEKGAGFDPIEWVRKTDKDEYPEFKKNEVSEDDMVIVYGEQKEENDGRKPTAPSQRVVPQQEDEARDIAKQKESAEESVNQRTPGNETEVQKPTKTDQIEESIITNEYPSQEESELPSSQDTKPGIAKQYAGKEQKESGERETQTVSAPQTKPKKQVSEKPQIKTVKEYWIQLGSFSKEHLAQEAAKTLRSQGVSGIISTKEIKEKTYFRLRLGPYENEAEARKFLYWVKNIRQFEDSYISVVYAKRKTGL